MASQQGAPQRPPKNSRVEFEADGLDHGTGKTSSVQPGPGIRVDEADGLSRRPSFLRRAQSGPLTEKVVQPTVSYADGHSRPEEGGGPPTASKLPSSGSEKLHKPLPPSRVDADGRPSPPGAPGSLQGTGGPGIVNTPEAAMAERERLASTYSHSALEYEG